MAEEVYGIKPDQVTGVPHTTEIATISGSSEVAEVISLSDSSGKGTPNMVRKVTINLNPRAMATIFRPLFNKVSWAPCLDFKRKIHKLFVNSLAFSFKNSTECTF